jgi:dipeptidyl-peptidase-3
MSQEFLCPTDLDIGDLHIDRVLSGLTPDQIKYATYLSLAGWAGFPILLNQIHPKAASIHAFLSDFLLNYPRAELQTATTGPLFHLLEYAVVFYFNSSQYLGFGDTKFVPRLTANELQALISPYPALKAKLDACVDAIYDVSASELHLGFGPANVTAYYEPADFSPSERAEVDALMKAAGIGLENTMIKRSSDRYEVKIYSIEKDDTGVKIGEFEGKPVFVTKGRESETLAKSVRWLRLARDAALNPREAEMLSLLIRHYETGNLADHIKYSELWVQDVDPVIEHYHGFVEVYRDPSGVRAEYEGIVAAFGAEDSAFLHRFVEASAKILPLLPYPPVYERKTFVAPSYNAINILNICASMHFMGINIPNYDEVRLNTGFKNVSLMNVMNGSVPTAKTLPFVEDAVMPKAIAFVARTCVLWIAGHELYGHGSAKLFSEKDVTENEIPNLLVPGERVTTFYAEGETFAAVFGDVHNAYEECRADTTSLHLAFKDEVLELYGIAPGDRQAFKVVSLLYLLDRAMKHLVDYSPEGGKWTQAHGRGRLAIMNAAVKWSDGGVTVQKRGERFKIVLDEAKFDKVEEAIATLLKHLNFYKSARLAKEGREFFEMMTTVDEFWLEVRKEAVAVPRGRMIEVQAVARKVGDGFTLEPIGGSPPTLLDAGLAIVESIKLALE